MLMMQMTRPPWLTQRKEKNLALLRRRIQRPAKAKREKEAAEMVESKAQKGKGEAKVAIECKYNCFDK
jgi:hypothetical protein